ncbi:MAG TPA: lipopolysaccharide kinase InaA family protein [Planctomycetota bacterium]
MVPQGSTPGNAQLPHSVSVQSGRALAVAAAPIAQALSELLRHDVSSWDQHGLLRTKERTVRSVFAGELASVPVHIKVFRADTFSDRARDALRGARGDRELRNLLRAKAVGLPVVEPLASGIACDGTQLRSFVVTRTVPAARPFAWPATVRAQQRVGALLRRVHDSGLVPGDLHPGNVAMDGDEQPWLLDLTSMRHAGEPDLQRRASALALFCHELDGGALDPAAKALRKAYVGDGLPAAFERELRLATHRWRAAALPAFGRRCTRSCRHTEVEARQRGRPRWHWHLSPGLDAAVRARCAAVAEAPPAPHKTGRRGSVWLLDEMAVKERSSGAARKLWRAAYWLLFAKVAAATPQALRLHRGRGLVFSRRVGARSLEAELAGGLLDAAAIAAAARSLGTNVGRLHAHGLGNRDLKFDNLVRDPASGEVCMVDLDGMSRGSTTDTRSRGADLGRLLAAFRAAGAPGGAATVARFLRSYLRANHRLLQQPPLRRLLRRAEHRAGEWAATH